MLNPRLLSGRRAIKLAGLAILTLGVLVSYSRCWLAWHDIQFLRTANN